MTVELSPAAQQVVNVVLIWLGFGVLTGLLARALLPGREPRGLTMGELSQRLMVTGGNVTGITDQLEAEGLVKRAPHPSDRRAFAVQLTPAGRRQFRRMASVHEQWVIELFAGWNGAEKNQVYALLATLKQHLASVDGASGKRSKTKKEPA